MLAIALLDQVLVNYICVFSKYEFFFILVRLPGILLFFICTCNFSCFIFLFLFLDWLKCALCLGKFSLMLLMWWCLHLFAILLLFLKFWWGFDLYSYDITMLFLIFWSGFWLKCPSCVGKISLMMLMLWFPLDLCPDVAGLLSVIVSRIIYCLFSHLTFFCYFVFLQFWSTYTNTRNEQYWSELDVWKARRRWIHISYFQKRIEEFHRICL